MTRPIGSGSIGTVDGSQHCHNDDFENPPILVKPPITTPTVSDPPGRHRCRLEIHLSAVTITIQPLSSLSPQSLDYDHPTTSISAIEADGSDTDDATVTINVIIDEEYNWPHRYL